MFKIIDSNREAEIHELSGVECRRLQVQCQRGSLRGSNKEIVKSVLHFGNVTCNVSCYHIA